MEAGKNTTTRVPIKSDMNTIIVPYFESLELYDRFILQQYSHHGDILINNYLRGTDTISIYYTNVVNALPKYLGSTFKFFCLYLEEIFETLSDDGKRIFNDNILESYYSYKKSEDDYKPDLKFIENYINTIYNPILNTKLVEKNLEYFRRMTYTILQKLNRIITNAPKYDKVFTVYRGIKNEYLTKDPTKISKLASFHSTTLDLDTAQSFGDFSGVIYEFLVHPQCNYIYVEPFTLHKGEDEILFTPENRYVFHSTKQVKTKYRVWTYNIYIVLPSEPGYTFPATYEEYRAYLQSIQTEQNLAEQNQTSLSRVRGAMGGGRKTRARKARKRSTRKRMTRRYRQRGGNVPEPEGSRWETPTPNTIPIEVNKLTRNDTKMIQNMMKGLV